MRMNQLFVDIWIAWTRLELLLDALCWYIAPIPSYNEITVTLPLYHLQLAIISLDDFFNDIQNTIFKNRRHWLPKERMLTTLKTFLDGLIFITRLSPVRVLIQPTSIILMKRDFKWALDRINTLSLETLPDKLT